MKWAIVVLNKRTVDDALDIQRKCKGIADIHIYTLPKYQVDQVKVIEGGLKAFNKTLFSEYKVIIYMMAMGIIVRDIAPYIRHKSLDPAVVCISPDGSYVIPVLSGHLGGANHIANILAAQIGGAPVITTASDVFDKIAVDLLAKAHNLVIDNYEDAKILTAMIINDDKVDILSDIPIQGIETVTELTNATKGVIRITNRTNESYDIPTATLLPKNIVIGIGARRDTPYHEINTFLNECLAKYQISRKAIVRLASIDLKVDEAGILALQEKLGVEYVVYSAEQLSQLENQFEQSTFVKKVTGVGAVSMPSGYLASNKGICLAKKIAKNGITISIWEERNR